MQGVNGQLFQSHLDHFCWKVMKMKKCMEIYDDMFICTFLPMMQQ